MSKASEEIFQSETPDATAHHGALWAKKIKKLPHLILLEGPVGAGKTVWVHGFISEYLKKKSVVTSPSYSLINRYSAGKKEVIHADFYRVQNEDDLESIGFWDLLSQNRVVIVEWGTLLKPEIWPGDLIVNVIKFEIQSQSKRLIKSKGRKGT